MINFKIMIAIYCIVMKIYLILQKKSKELWHKYQ